MLLLLGFFRLTRTVFGELLNGPIVEDGSVVGLEAERLGVIGHGSIEIAFLKTCKAPTDQGVDIVRLRRSASV